MSFHTFMNVMNARINVTSTPLPQKIEVSNEDVIDTRPPSSTMIFNDPTLKLIRPYLVAAFTRPHLSALLGEPRRCCDGIRTVVQAADDRRLRGPDVGLSGSSLSRFDGACRDVDDASARLGLVALLSAFTGSGEKFNAKITVSDGDLFRQ